MKKLILYTFILSLVTLHQYSIKAQCTVGDLSATNISVGPQDIRSCNKAIVTAEWLQQAQVPYDANFHQGVLFVSLPTEFIGTSGTLSVTASNGNIYWNPDSISLTDDQIRVPLSGIIPSGVQITILISEMDVVLNGAFALVNISKSVGNVVSDCNSNNDEQQTNVLLQQADAPLVTDIQATCTGTDLAVDLSAQQGTTNGGAISSYSWTGPNGFTSEDADPSFMVPEGQKDDYTGTYMVTVTDDNGCTTDSSIDLDGTNCLVLPIELLNFQAIPGKEDVLLKWKTATELNNSHFDIERSPDGRNYTKIGEVKGSGTTSEFIDYAFTDDNPLPGKSYYRLKQVDFGGSYEYSHVEEVSFGGDSFLKVFPNPLSPGTEINIHGQKIESVKIFNILGQLMIEETYDSPRTRVVISSAKLSEGIYIAKVNGINDKKLVIK